MIIYILLFKYYIVVCVKQKITSIIKTKNISNINNIFPHMKIKTYFNNNFLIFILIYSLALTK